MTSLNDTRIDIWRFSLKKPYSSIEESTLSNDEVERARRFYLPQHQRRFVIARTMLRKILAQYLAQAPETLRFDYNAQGKPSLAQRPLELEFNLSHSGEQALLAVGQTHPLGIDIEYFSARPYLGISRTLFSANEQKNLLALPDALQPLGFFNVWAQKEALIKAMGLGLSYPTQHLNFPLLPNQAFMFYDQHSHLEWKIYPFMPGTACSAALCYHPGIQTIRYLNGN